MLTASAQGVSLASANGQELALEKPSSSFFVSSCALFCRQFMQGNTDSVHLPFGVLKVLCICNSCSFKNEECHG